MNTPFNQYNEVLDYVVIEGYQEGCISITNDEPTDADLTRLSYNGELYGFIERNPNFFLYPPVIAERSDRPIVVYKGTYHGLSFRVFECAQCCVLKRTIPSTPFPRKQVDCQPTPPSWPRCGRQQAILDAATAHLRVFGRRKGNQL
jgi:hypothetical protein